MPLTQIRVMKKIAIRLTDQIRVIKMFLIVLLIKYSWHDCNYIVNYTRNPMRFRNKFIDAILKAGEEFLFFHKYSDSQTTRIAMRKLSGSPYKSIKIPYKR